MTDVTTGADEATEDLTLDAPELEGEQEQEEQSGADTTAAPDEPAPKPKKSAKDRIDELTAARREAEREAEYWRSKATQAPAPAQEPQQPLRDEAEPDPSKYTYGETDANFIRDHATYHARKAFREEQERDQQARAQQTAQAQFAEREAKAVEQFDDFYQVVGHGYDKAVKVIPQAAQQAILECEVGPQIAYHLAKNPAEARRLSAMSPLSQAREIGRLEAKLTAAPLTPKTATQAPEPSPSLRGAGGRFAPAPDTADFRQFEALADKELGGS
jgi:hypothetical protein